jgi:hypothetical protein
MKSYMFILILNLNNTDIFVLDERLQLLEALFLWLTHHPYDGSSNML